MREQRFTHDWIPSEISRLGKMLKEGMSAGQIAEQFNVTRNAIIGIVHRDKTLSAIGFDRSPKNRPEGWTPKRTDRRPKPSNVVKFPMVSPARHPTPQNPFPALRVVSNNTSLMVEDWLDQNCPRRFERVERTDPFSIKTYLEERGFKLSGGWQGHSTIVGKGYKRTHMKWAQVMEFVDAIRIKEGRQPFKRATL